MVRNEGHACQVQVLVSSYKSLDQVVPHLQAGWLGSMHRTEGMNRLWNKCQVAWHYTAIWQAKCVMLRTNTFIMHVPRMSKGTVVINGAHARAQWFHAWMSICPLVVMWCTKPPNSYCIPILCHRSTALAQVHCSTMQHSNAIGCSCWQQCEHHTSVVKDIQQL